MDASDADLVILEVRERNAYAAGHVPGARHLPRGQLDLRVNDELPDPSGGSCCADKSFSRMSQHRLLQSNSDVEAAASNTVRRRHLILHCVIKFSPTSVNSFLTADVDWC